MTKLGAQLRTDDVQKKPPLPSRWGNTTNIILLVVWIVVLLIMLNTLQAISDHSPVIWQKQNWHMFGMAILPTIMGLGVAVLWHANWLQKNHQIKFGLDGRDDKTLTGLLIIAGIGFCALVMGIQKYNIRHDHGHSRSFVLNAQYQWQKNNRLNYRVKGERSGRLFIQQDLMRKYHLNNQQKQFVLTLQRGHLGIEYPIQLETTAQNTQAKIIIWKRP